MKVAGSGFKGEGAAAGAGRRSVFNNVAGAVIGEYLKSPVSKVAGNGIFKMSQSQSQAAAPAIRGMDNYSLCFPLPYTVGLHSFSTSELYMSKAKPRGATPHSSYQ